MSKVSSGVPQPSRKKPKLDEETPCPAPLPTGKFDATTPISPLPVEEDSSDDDCLQDAFDPFEIEDVEPLGNLRRVTFRCNLGDLVCKKQLTECVDFAVEEYNSLVDANSKLQQANIVKATQCHMALDIHYYITFNAQNALSKQVTYQADLSVSTKREEKTISFIREKGQRKEFLYPIDLADQNESHRMSKFAVSAVAEYNYCEEENPHLEFVKILKAVQNIRRDTYRLSLKAKNIKSQEIGTYYAEVQYCRLDDVGLISLMPKDEMKDEHFFSLMDTYWDFAIKNRLRLEALEKLSKHGVL